MNVREVIKGCGGIIGIGCVILVVIAHLIPDRMMQWIEQPGGALFLKVIAGIAIVLIVCLFLADLISALIEGARWFCKPSIPPDKQSADAEDRGAEGKERESEHSAQKPD